MFFHHSLSTLIYSQYVELNESDMDIKSLENNWPIILKAIRAQLNGSQYDLSRYTGVNQSRIARIEKGKVKNSISADELESLSKLLNISEASLRTGRFDTTPQMKQAIRLLGLRTPGNPKYVLSRAITPLLQFIAEDLGDKRVWELIRDVGLKEDIFVFRDCKIDLDKFHILISAILDNKILEKKYFGEIARKSFNSDMYGEQLYKKLCQVKDPLRRLKLYFSQGPALENFSKIEFRRVGRENAVLYRQFKDLPPTDLTINGLKDTFSRQLWSEYFTHHIKSICQSMESVLNFDIYEPNCQWCGAEYSEYQLQVDY